MSNYNVFNTYDPYTGRLRAPHPTNDFEIDTNNIGYPNVKPLGLRGSLPFNHPVPRVVGRTGKHVDKMPIEMYEGGNLPQGTYMPKYPDLVFEGPIQLPIHSEFYLPSNTELMSYLNTYPDGTRKSTIEKDPQSHRKEVLQTYETLVQRANNIQNPQVSSEELDKAHRYLLANDPEMYRALNSYNVRHQLEGVQQVEEQPSSPVEEKSVSNAIEISRRRALEAKKELEDLRDGLSNGAKVNQTVREIVDSINGLLDNMDKSPSPRTSKKLFNSFGKSFKKGIDDGSTDKTLEIIKKMTKGSGSKLTITESKIESKDENKSEDDFTIKSQGMDVSIVSVDGIKSLNDDQVDRLYGALRLGGVEIEEDTLKDIRKVMESESYANNENRRNLLALSIVYSEIGESVPIEFIEWLVKEGKVESTSTNNMVKIKSLKKLVPDLPDLFLEFMNLQ